jgi:hypothetical protein
MKQSNKKSNVEVKILSVNNLYKYAKQFFEYERTHFLQFLGQSIFKVDGSVKAKFDHEKQSYKGQLPDGTWVNAHYWFTSSYGYFDIHVKICVNGGSYDVKPTTVFCQYDETTLTMFKIEDGKLIDSPADISHLDQVFNIQELQKAAKGIEEAAKAYNDECKKLPYMFHDVFLVSRLSR